MVESIAEATCGQYQKAAGDCDILGEQMKLIGRAKVSVKDRRRYESECD